MTCLELKSRTIRLREALYYDPSQRKGGNLKKGLLEYQFLLMIACQVARILKKGDLDKFDALVGDNACQIRAVRIVFAFMSINLINIDNIINKINFLINKTKKLLFPASMNILMHKKASLLQVIEEYGLELFLSEDEFFILQSFLLCEAKLCLPDDEFMPSLLRKEKYSAKQLSNKHPSLSYSFIAKLTNSLRIRLSRDSVYFVRKIADKFKDPVLSRMISSEFEISHNDLLCIPAFWTIKALFYFAQSSGLPLAFHAKFLCWGGETYQVIKEDLLFFKPIGDQKLYKLHNPVDFDPKDPVCVIEGVLTNNIPRKLWRKKMQSKSPLDILLAIGADHRQLPSSIMAFLEKDIERSYYKNIAEREGFTLSNPTTFFARHIYPSTVSSIIEKVDSSQEVRVISQELQYI